MSAASNALSVCVLTHCICFRIRLAGNMMNDAQACSDTHPLSAETLIPALHFTQRFSNALHCPRCFSTTR